MRLIDADAAIKDARANYGGVHDAVIMEHFLRAQPTVTSVSNAIARLAAYEDTGLSPEEITAAANRRHDCKIDCLLKVYNNLLEEIEQLGGMDKIREVMR